MYAYSSRGKMSERFSEKDLTLGSIRKLLPKIKMVGKLSEMHDVRVWTNY